MRDTPGKGKVGSAWYWEQRYKRGQTSGSGSYGQRAVVKAQVVNTFVQLLRVESVAELGCGDGAQLRRMRYRRYVGVDVSPTVISKVRAVYAKDPTKSFLLDDGTAAGHARVRQLRAELAVSLEVIFHLTEDQVFQRYMDALFHIATRYVLIMSSDRPDGNNTDAHVRHWPVTAHVRDTQPQWELLETVPFPSPHSFSSFFFFCRTDSSCPRDGKPLHLHKILATKTAFRNAPPSRRHDARPSR